MSVTHYDVEYWREKMDGGYWEADIVYNQLGEEAARRALTALRKSDPGDKWRVVKVTTEVQDW